MSWKFGKKNENPCFHYLPGNPVHSLLIEEYFVLVDTPSRHVIPSVHCRRNSVALWHICRVILILVTGFFNFANCKSSQLYTKSKRPQEQTLLKNALYNYVIQEKWCSLRILAMYAPQSVGGQWSYLETQLDYIRLWANINKNCNTFLQAGFLNPCDTHLIVSCYMYTVKTFLSQFIPVMSKFQISQQQF